MFDFGCYIQSMWRQSFLSKQYNLLTGGSQFTVGRNVAE